MMRDKISGGRSSHAKMLRGRNLFLVRVLNEEVDVG